MAGFDDPQTTFNIWTVEQTAAILFQVRCFSFDLKKEGKSKSYAADKTIKCYLVSIARTKVALCYGAYSGVCL